MTDRTSVAQTVHTEIVQLNPDAATATITDDMHLGDDLGLDSIDMVDLCLSCEEVFKVEINDDEKYDTVGELIALIQRKLA